MMLSSPRPLGPGLGLGLFLGSGWCRRRLLSDTSAVIQPPARTIAIVNVAVSLKAGHSHCLVCLSVCLSVVYVCIAQAEISQQKATLTQPHPHNMQQVPADRCLSTLIALPCPSSCMCVSARECVRERVTLSYLYYIQHMYLRCC